MNNNERYNGITTDGAKAVAEAIELSKYEHNELARHQKLSELADDNVAYTIRMNVIHLWADYFFDDAMAWLSIRSKKYDRRKKYHEKEAYDALVNVLKEVFQTEVLEVFSMNYEGYEQYTRWIEFTTDSDYVFHMTVPVVKRITPKLMSMVNYGKIALGYYQAEHSILVCGSSYNLLELKSVMDEILTAEMYQRHLPAKDAQASVSYNR